MYNQNRSAALSLVFPRYRVGPLWHFSADWSLPGVIKPTSVGFFTSEYLPVFPGCQGWLCPWSTLVRRGLSSLFHHRVEKRAHRMDWAKTTQQWHGIVVPGADLLVVSKDCNSPQI